MDIQTAMAILIGVCVVCFIGLMLIWRHYKKIKEQESRLTELGMIVPIEKDDEIEPLAEKTQVDDEYELVAPYSVRDDFEARLLQRSLDSRIDPAE